MVGAYYKRDPTRHKNKKQTNKTVRLKTVLNKIQRAIYHLKQLTLHVLFIYP